MKRIALLTLLAAAAVAPPGHAETFFDSSKRPHSTLDLRNQGDIVVERLQASVVRRSGRLRVTIAFAGRARRGSLSVVLRAGRCVGGEQAFQSCPATYSRALSLRTDAATTKRVTITLRQPPPGQDAIEVQVTRPGRQKTPFDRGHGYRPNGDLILRGTAWRGANAGERFGATTFGPQVHALRVDAAGLSQDRLLVGLRTTLDLPAGTKVDERLAPGTDLIDPRTRRFPVTATGQEGGTPFGARPSIARDGETVLRFAALRESEGSAPYADVTLPWPVGPG